MRRAALVRAVFSSAGEAMPPLAVARSTMRRASTRKPNATTSVNAAARSSATAKSPTNAPERIESASRTMSSSVGPDPRRRWRTRWWPPVHPRAIGGQSSRGSFASMCAACTAATAHRATNRVRRHSIVRRFHPRRRSPPALARDARLPGPHYAARDPAVLRQTDDSSRSTLADPIRQPGHRLRLGRAEQGGLDGRSPCEPGQTLRPPRAKNQNRGPGCRRYHYARRGRLRRQPRNWRNRGMRA